jgi:hypothetical protein
VSARRSLASTDQLKTLMRTTLQTIKEEPSSEVARAMVTGTTGTVAGRLFGEEETRYAPGAPSTTQALKVRGAQRDEKPVHAARWGWALKTGGGHYFALVHGEAAPSGPTQGIGGRSEPTALVVACETAGGWFPVRMDLKTKSVDEEPFDGLMDEQSAYRAIVQHAADSTEAMNLLNPAAPWRKKPSPLDSGARKLARRLARNVEIPDNATAGYVSDVITMAKYAAVVDELGNWVRQQTTT